jgi:LPXTG-site transpeptidase (sortase) family protein
MARELISRLAVLVGAVLIGGALLTGLGPRPAVSEAPAAIDSVHPPRQAPAVTGTDVAEPPRRATGGDRPHARDRDERPQRPQRYRIGRPEWLSVPGMGIEAAVSPISLDGSLTLVPPADYTTVGWWQEGARPGARRGTAILAGHTVHTGGGALDDLDAVRPGDRVVVTGVKGRLEYDVAAVTIYGKGQLADMADRVFSQDVDGRLALVTCEDWDGTGYRSNVVVIARPRS